MIVDSWNSYKETTEEDPTEGGQEAEDEDSDSERITAR